MPERIYTDLIYPLEGESNRRYPSFPAVVTPMPVGGAEGRKYTVVMQHPLRKDDEHTLSFIAKEFSRSFRIQKIEGIVAMYRELYRYGYPVPEKVSRFKYNGQEHLAMSNMREGGIYRLWGFNDGSTAEEMMELRAMQLSQENLENAKGQILAIADQATRDGYSFAQYNYHIRKHIELGTVSIILLDVSPDEYKGGLEENNSEEGLRFINLLSGLVGK